MKQKEDNLNCLYCKNKSYCFEHLTTDELEIVNMGRVCLKYKKGEVIEKQGNIVNQIHYVKQGLTKAYKEINDNKNLILNFFPEGALIGLPSLFSDSVSQYSVAAVEDCIICSISKTDFERFVKENLNFAAAVIKTINNCNVYNFGKIVSLTQKQLSGRIAEALLFLADIIYQKDSFHFSLSRKDLAEFTGMSVMSVVRILQDFNKDGIINMNGKNMEIVNRKMLISISNKG